MNYILNDRGLPVAEPDILKWAAWFETAERHLADDTPAPGVRVSTVFLGIDHNWSRTRGLPLLWETMIFWDGHDLDQEQKRYVSRTDALAGHARMVERVLAALRLN